jgi:hypothetical protein
MRKKIYFFVVRYVCIGIAPILLDNEMPVLVDLLTILPTYQTPTEFGDHAVITIPSFDIKSTPYTPLFEPKRADPGKVVTTYVKSRSATLQTFVVLVNFLKQFKRVLNGCRTTAR